MRRPRTDWHQEILETAILENLDDAADRHDELLIELAQRHTDPSPGETPEFIAKQIGYWVVESGDTDAGFSTPACNDTNGEEGKKMALGYIGVKAFELADIGSVPEV